MTTLVPRLSICLTILSCVFWFTSWPFVSVGADFPNCISARWVNGGIAVGCLSHQRLSSFFVTRNFEAGSPNVWSERRDGHFCGFPIPPSTNSAAPPQGFNIHLGRDAIAWDCPYLLMAAIWLTVFIRSRPTIRFSLSELLSATTVVAIVGALIHWRMALLCTVPLNLVTAAMVIYLAFRCLWWLLHDEIALWPLVTKQTTINESPV